MCNCAATINQGPENWQPTRFAVKDLEWEEGTEMLPMGDGERGRARQDRPVVYHGLIMPCCQVFVWETGKVVCVWRGQQGER